MKYFTPFNKHSTEYNVMVGESESDSEELEDDTTVLWRVTPDYGEKDHTVVSREEDIENGKKKSGWTNPLGWHDNGHGDD